MEMPPSPFYIYSVTFSPFAFFKLALNFFPHSSYVSPSRTNNVSSVPKERFF